jgi:hypothetical protein
MWYFNKRYRRRPENSKEDSKISVQAPLETQCDSISTPGLTIDTRTSEDYFAAHICKYIGETVTVFVSGGGVSGSGFTGILLSANCIYIQLITRIGPPPSCMLSNTCSYPSFWSNTPKPIPAFNITDNMTGIVNTLGSITYIPVNKIASFVHNTV